MAPLGSSSAKIIHVSDLHFGTKDHDQVWPAVRSQLVKEEADLLAVTGDIADTPKRKLWEHALGTSTQIGLAGIAKRLLVCAGNHDRTWKGNRVGPLHALRLPGPHKSTAFDRTFGAQVADIAKPEIVDVGAFKVAVFGLDSSWNAPCLGFARGRVTQEQIDQLGDQVASVRGQCHLVVLLIHHHVLSVPHSHEATVIEDEALHLCVNAPRLLDKCVKVGVDIVLHGHRHADFQAEYTSNLTPPRRRVVVLGVGSGTGASGGRCDLLRARYNALSLKSDGSVQLTRRMYSDSIWVADTPIDVFSPGFLHANKHPISTLEEQKSGVSKIVKVVEFLQNRDIIASTNFFNIPLPRSEYYEIAVSNSTGDVRSHRGPTLEIEDGALHIVQLKRRPRDRGKVYEFEGLLREDFRGRALRHRVTVRWEWGAVLTHEECEQVHQFGGVDRIRENGHEYSGVPVRASIDELQLILRMPEAYAPTSAPRIEVLSIPSEPSDFHAPNRELEHEKIRLLNAVEELRRGEYQLTVKSPRVGLVYALKWQPPAGERELQAAQQAQRLLEQGGVKAAMQRFRKALMQRKTPCDAELLLYCREGDRGMYARPTMLVGSTGRVVLNLATVPGMVREPIGHWRNALSRAFWGTTIYTPSLTENRGEVHVPLTAESSQEPWGVVKIGTHELGAPVPLSDLTQIQEAARWAFSSHGSHARNGRR